MQRLAMIGLGRMGMNMTKRLLDGGVEVVAHTRTRARVEEAAAAGAIAAFSLAEVVERLEPPRVVWLMLPAGRPTEQVIGELTGLLQVGDILVDGGNTLYTDDLRRADILAGHGVHYLDVGVSGGIWGRNQGYCLMIGGDQKLVEGLEPVFAALAPPGGFLHCGPVGAGHFVKMVHNGIEYGMMQAYGEGFALLEASPYGQLLDFSRLARLWNQGSVIRSWLLELLETAFANSPRLEDLQGWVDDSGEGRWTVQQGVELGVPLPVISAALFSRFQSRLPDGFGNRVLAALRREFGGHPVKTKTHGQEAP